MYKRILDRYVILVMLLFLFHLVNNYVIITTDNTPLIPDAADCLIISFQCYDVLVSQPLAYFRYIDVMDTHHPPVLMLSALPLTIIFGKDTDIASMTGSFYLLVLLFSVYGIGKTLKDKRTGLMASFIVSTFPVIFGLSRLFLVDIASIAVVSLSIYLMLLTDNFRNFKYTLLFGASLGLGMLTRWTYISFIIGPFSYYLYLSLFRNPKGAFRNRLKNIIISVLIGCAVAAIWYLPNLTTLTSELRQVAFSPTMPTLHPDSQSVTHEDFLFYFTKALPRQVHYFYFAMFIISFAYLTVRRRPTDILLILWVIPPYLLFSLATRKCVRYDAAMLPAVALIIAMAVYEIKNPKFRKVSLLIVLIVGLTQFFAISYDMSPFFLDIYTRYDRQYGYPFHVGTLFADPTDWHENDIVDVMSEHYDGDETASVLVVSPTHPMTSETTMNLLSMLQNKPFWTNTPMNCIEANYVCDIDYDSLVSEADFVLEMPQHMLVERLQSRPRYFSIEQNKLTNAFEKQKGDFEHIGTYESPEGWDILIYKRTNIRQ